MFGMSIQQQFGQHAIHIPAWMIVQDQGAVTAFVGATKDPQIRYGSDKPHQLVLGELIVRPHLIMASDEFVGYGLNGLATGANMEFDKWVRGDLIADPIGRLSEIMKG